METRHIKIDYEEALASKKNLLTSEINLLNVLRKINAYKTLRKRELLNKNRLRVQLGNLRKRIDLLQSSFPVEDYFKVKRKPAVKKTVSRKVGSNDVSGELEEIKRKLEKLG